MLRRFVKKSFRRHPRRVHVPISLILRSYYIMLCTILKYYATIMLWWMRFPLVRITCGNIRAVCDVMCERDRIIISDIIFFPCYKYFLSQLIFRQWHQDLLLFQCTDLRQHGSSIQCKHANVKYFQPIAK